MNFLLVLFFDLYAVTIDSNLRDTMMLHLMFDACRKYRLVDAKNTDFSDTPCHVVVVGIALVS